MEQNSDIPRDCSKSRKRGSPATAASGGRLTRSRARELGLKLVTAALPDLGGRRGKKRQRQTEEGSEQLEPLPMKGNLEKQEDEKDSIQKSKSTAAGGGGSLAATITNPRPEPSIKMIDPTSYLGAQRRHVEYNSNAQALKDLLAGGAPWLVHISSTSLDGKEIGQFSGIVVHCDKEKTWILTSYRVVFCTLDDRLYDPVPKLLIHVPKATHLPNNGIYEGNMVFFNEHYRLAVLEIGETNFEMDHPPYGSSPSYNDEVSSLARDENLSLTLCHGRIQWLEEDHFMFPSYKLCPFGIGGAVINGAGDIVGMSCDDDGRDPFIIRITTIHKCIEMWKLGHTLRPALGMCFRTVDLLDLQLQDCLRHKYGVNNVFIVDEVIINSPAEKRGIRRGDVITSFHGKCCYLPEFEDFLLSVGLDSLNGLKQVDDFKVVAIKKHAFKPTYVEKSRYWTRELVVFQGKNLKHDKGTNTIWYGGYILWLRSILRRLDLPKSDGIGPEPCVCKIDNMEEERLPR